MVVVVEEEVVVVGGVVASVPLVEYFLKQLVDID